MPATWSKRICAPELLQVMQNEAAQRKPSRARKVDNKFGNTDRAFTKTRVLSSSATP